MMKHTTSTHGECLAEMGNKHRSPDWRAPQNRTVTNGPDRGNHKVERRPEGARKTPTSKPPKRAKGVRSLCGRNTCQSGITDKQDVRFVTDRSLRGNNWHVDRSNIDRRTLSRVGTKGTMGQPVIERNE
ncbi:hypothetical protein R1flu_002846 [Riccia fluitans]|uniref:HNH endonuclease n=1 Tax=Riccia fluitans TaxID=41844 RepID=A0ABD1Y7A8_9MARC